MSDNPNESAPVIYVMDELSERAKQAVLNHLRGMLPDSPRADVTASTIPFVVPVMPSRAINPETAFDSYGERYGDWFLNRFCTFAFDRAPGADEEKGVGENGLKD